MPTRRAARSPDELAFLRTITSDLSDQLPQLVYADWLEEQADPLGPFLRDFVQACQNNDPLPNDPPNLSAVWAEVLALPLRRLLREEVRYRKGEPATAGPLLDYKATILQITRPCVGFAIKKARPLERTPTGISRAGGLPELPSGVQWPMYSERGQEWPMQFCFK